MMKAIFFHLKVFPLYDLVVPYAARIINAHKKIASKRRPKRRPKKGRHIGVKGDDLFSDDVLDVTRTEKNVVKTMSIKRMSRSFWIFFGSNVSFKDTFLHRVATTYV
jgi:hypothetical protein